MVVNNNNDGATTENGGMGARLGSGATTSVTVITSNGVVSYREGGPQGGVAVGRVAGWAVNFDRLMRDVVGLATFTVSTM